MNELQVRDIAEKLSRIFLRLRARTRTGDTRPGGSQSQGAMLENLCGEHKRSLKDLAGRLDVSPSTASLGVDKLITEGLVRKATDKSDKRRVVLLLTKKGLKAQAQANVIDEARLSSLVEHLSETEAKQIVDGLSLLLAATEDDD